MANIATSASAAAWKGPWAVPQAARACWVSLPMPPSPRLAALPKAFVPPDDPSPMLSSASCAPSCLASSSQCQTCTAIATQLKGCCSASATPHSMADCPHLAVGDKGVCIHTKLQLHQVYMLSLALTVEIAATLEPSVWIGVSGFSWFLEGGSSTCACYLFQ